MSDIKLLYHNECNYRVQFSNVDALLALCARLGYHLADNGPTSDTYTPVTSTQAREMWAAITDIRTSADARLDYHYRYAMWRAVYVLDAHQQLAGVTGVYWRYLNASHAISWYIDCGLSWETHPLPAAACKLLAVLIRRDQAGRDVTDLPGMWAESDTVEVNA